MAERVVIVVACNGIEAAERSDADKTWEVEVVCVGVPGPGGRGKGCTQAGALHSQRAAGVSGDTFAHIGDVDFGGLIPWRRKLNLGLSRGEFSRLDAVFSEDI
ncbi:UNVERIFIED_CONTAM: hypothetical protein Sradi_0994000 [Sesamum radiatum]|uniref:Uncharacterized protein n=1 Tax=Sesamum radiatum TaxID=300843 RepID=A0AAW2V7Y3_SESRA